MPKQRTISKDIPLSEITLRKYERPVNLTERELVRKLCLSIGLLQPGDSRDVVVDIFHIMIKSAKNLTSDEVCKKVIDQRKENKLNMLGIAPSNVRRQIRRLKDLMLIEKRLNAYRISENNKLQLVFEEKIEKFLLPNINLRIKEYLAKLDELRPVNNDNVSN